MSAFGSRQFSEMVAIVGTVDPSAYSSGTFNTDWADMSKFESFALVGQTGILAGTAAVNAKIQQATDSTGGGAKDIDSSSITALGGTSDDDSQFVIQGRGEHLDVASTFRYIRGSATLATSVSSGFSMVLFGVNPFHGPASDNDLASVAEIVTCTS